MFKHQFLGIFSVTVSTASLVTLSSFANSAKAATLNKVTDWQFFGGGSYSDNSINLSTLGLDENASEIANFLGISNEDLENLAPFRAVGGSAAKTTLNVKGGDTLNFDWFFDDRDQFPFNDFSFWTINNTATLLTDILHVRILGFPRNGSESYTFATGGTYTLGFGIVDSLDEAGDSGLTVSNITITSVTSVPEPTTILGFLGIATVLAVTKKRNS